MYRNKALEIKQYESDTLVSLVFPFGLMVVYIEHAPKYSVGKSAIVQVISSVQYWL